MAGLSAAEIANLALGHIGVAKTISSLDDKSSEARACKRFFDRAVDTTQARYPFKNALKTVALALLPSNDWSDEFAYAYRLPDECKWFRRIRIGTHNTDPQPPYRIVSDDDGQIILTDIQNAVAEYSIKIDDPSLWTDEQVNATSYRLAAFMARTFDEDNATATRKEMEQLYEIEISRAAAKDLNQDEPPERPKSEFETCRW